MQTLQHELPFPATMAQKNSAAAEARRKHELIRGRPRRLEDDYHIDEHDWDRILGTLSTKTGSEEEAEFALGLTEPTKVPPNAAIKEALSAFAARAEVIKVAINKQLMAEIDRVRAKIPGGATRPEMVRIMVEAFLEGAKEFLEGLVPPKDPPPLEKRQAEPGRCTYLKVPFSPYAIQFIGHQASDEQPATGLCAIFGKTRQGVIHSGIRWYLEQMK